ncbi:tetratricopeptide repeat-containing sulfotransferase family protein [Sphingomonas humi]|uniref:Tetratricopeptide repeat protein n=1 Tax=Sphingomonas humi TaxID=335630 RepID=A0ABP7RHM2_9SPHN
MSGERAMRAMAAGAEALQRGDLPRAEAAFAEAVEADPGLADGWFNLGWVQRARRRFEAALESYARALGAGVQGAEEVHVNRAAILADHLLDPVAAAGEYQRALSLHDAYPPALLGLAQLHEDEGRRDEATDCYRRLLRSDPGDGRAAARIAALQLAEGDPGTIAAELAAKVERARRPEDQAELLFALATALDAGGRYGEAFRALDQANALAARLSPVRYDARGFEQLVDRLIASFPAGSGGEPDAFSPVFICGLFRSGSTLAEQVLARHPALTAGGELEAIPAIAASLQPYPEAVPQLGEEAVGRLRKDYREEARRSASDGRHTDKRCDNFLHLGLIKRLFPGAAIVHTVRHPLDNLLSTYFLRFGDGVSYSHRLDEAVHHAVQHERLMRHWRQVMPASIVELSYDRLVRDPRGALAPVLERLGLEWTDALLDAGAVGAVRTASNWQVRQPLHARSSGRWRHYEAELEGARRQLIAGGVPVPD